MNVSAKCYAYPQPAEIFKIISSPLLSSISKTQDLILIRAYVAKLTITPHGFLFTKAVPLLSPNNTSAVVPMVICNSYAVGESSVLVPSAPI
jgi:hypothetical protein